MAPALTEPLSPSEKLTSSTVKARATPTTRSSRKIEPVTKKHYNNCTENTFSSGEENRKCNADASASPSKRITRSKDNKHLKPVTTISVLTLNTKKNTTRKNFSRSNGCNKKSNSDIKKNEQMGLNAASISINNNNIKNTIKDTDSNTIACQASSTSQLLEDLTNETLTAEICLRNQLKDVNLKKSPEQNLRINTNSTPEATNLLTNTTNHIAHMETAQQSNETLKSELKDLKTVIESESSSVQKSKPLTHNNNDEIKSIQAEDAKEPKPERIITELLGEGASSNQSPTALLPATEKEVKKAITAKLEIIAVDELPTINTDSTMTASEVEDNLEERLSQLDGTAVQSSESNKEIPRNANEKILPNSANATLRTLRTNITTQDILQLAQKTPPTSPSQNPQMQQNTSTPQSIASSVNILGGVNTPQSVTKESEVGELEDQEIEEVFKVLKGIESGGSSDLNICDLNVLFNEVYSSLKINEAEMSNHGNIAAAIPPSIQPLKPTELQERQLEIEKRHQQMQRKIEVLTRRLRILQARYMCKHTSEEIAGLFEWCARQANKCVGSVNSIRSGMAPSTSGTLEASTGPEATQKYLLKVIASRPPATHWNEELTLPIPSTQISALLRKIDSVANSQQLCTAPTTSYASLQLHHRKPKKSQTIPPQCTTMASTNDAGKFEDVVGTLDEEVTDELTEVAGLLQSEMREVQRAIDSDATESSSGGESADEMVTFNNQQQQKLPITKRAAWRYSRDRAAIASRWSWLLSQIADLEIKIRQHSDLHQELVRSKGSVTCTSFENGIRTNWNYQEGEGKEQSGSCRTRGYDASLFRKRKLIQTTNLHTISKKAARPSTIKCGCQWPLHPCALCTGRSDPTAPRDLPDTMMMSDRIALLDSGYHAVLSFRENVNNALHFEAIARLPEWQQRVMRSQAKSIAKSVWKAEKEAVGIHSTKRHGLDVPTTKRKYIKKKDRLNEEKAAAGPPPNATSTASDVGNGTAILSTTTTTTPTTPHVANKETTKHMKKQHMPQMNEKSMRDPSLYNNATSTAVNCSSNKVRYTSDPFSQKNDLFNLSQTPPSLIFNPSNSNSKNYKNRKLSNSQPHNSPYVQQTSTSSNNFHNSYNNAVNYNTSSMQYNGETSFQHSNDNWSVDSFTGRSRNSSPIHASSGTNYHKYDRILDRKSRTSYDIDNIVIPYSVAAATRVEILPYKEIPTPKWRVIKNESMENGIANTLSPTLNGVIKNDDDDEELKNFDGVAADSEIGTGDITEIRRCNKDEKYATETYDGKEEGRAKSVDENHIKEPLTKKVKLAERCSVLRSEELENKIYNVETNQNTNDSEQAPHEEDISDETMIQRHDRALTEERRKFQTYLKFPWSTRSRANRRIDSRAESSGANTPDPSSPAPQTPSLGGGDQESIPSPMAPGTPLNSLDNMSEPADISTSFLGVNLTCSKRYERRRTTSSRRDRELERRSSTPDSKEGMPPFEPLHFPLSDQQYEELRRNSNCDQLKESKTFQECLLKCPRISHLKRNLRIAHLGNDSRGRRQKNATNKSLRPVSADDSLIIDENVELMPVLYSDDDEDRHHLAPPNDDNLLTHLNSVDDDFFAADYKDDVERRKHRRNNAESEGESTDTEPFQDDDPNDPEWRGEPEDRTRKKA